MTYGMKLIVLVMFAAAAALIGFHLFMASTAQAGGIVIDHQSARLVGEWCDVWGQFACGNGYWWGGWYGGGW